MTFKEDSAVLIVRLFFSASSVGTLGIVRVGASNFKKKKQTYLLNDFLKFEVLEKLKVAVLPSRFFLNL